MFSLLAGRKTAGGGRAGRLLRSRAGAGVRLPRQAGRAARVEDAFHRRTLGRSACRRRLVEECAARERVRAAARGKLRGAGGIRLAFPREANALFLRLSEEIATRLRTRGWHFLQIHRAGCLPAYVLVVDDGEGDRRFYKRFSERTCPVAGVGDPGSPAQRATS